MRDAGRFIVLEGGEGVGKSTQAALLGAWLEALGVPHVVTREPGGTPVGEAVRSVVLARTDLEMPAETELFLYLASRAAFVRDVVRPALEAGKTVVADRFDLSTLAYQGFGRGLDLDEVRRAIALATGGLHARPVRVPGHAGGRGRGAAAGRGQGPGPHRAGGWRVPAQGARGVPRAGGARAEGAGRGGAGAPGRGARPGPSVSWSGEFPETFAPRRFRPRSAGRNWPEDPRNVWKGRECAEAWWRRWWSWPPPY